MASGHQLCSGTTQLGLFRLGALTGGLQGYMSAGRGPVAGPSAACVLGGVPDQVTFGRIIRRKYVGRGTSSFGSLAPEAGSFNQTHAFVGVEAT